MSDDNSAGRVMGLGGVFVRANDTEALAKWYQDVLGFPYDGYGSSFVFRDDKDPGEAYGVWGLFKADTDYFKPSTKDFMINLRVDDMDAFLAKIKEKGVEPTDGPISEPYGKFAWIVDPEGTKIELWEQIGKFGAC